MNRLLTLAALTTAALFFTAAASAGTVPFWYWSTSQAAKTLVRVNPQKIDYRGDHTTIQSAECAGVGTAKVRSRVRVFHEFNCAVRFHDDDTDLTGSLHIAFATSKTKRGAIACVSRSHEGLVAKRCV